MEENWQRRSERLKLPRPSFRYSRPAAAGLPEFVAATHDVEIEIAVAVGVEQCGVHVFVQTVDAKGGLGRAAETTGASCTNSAPGCHLARGVNVVPGRRR